MKLEYIVSNPKILSGMPVIKGTRVPVARLLHLLKDGYTLENISDQYPHIQKNKIKKAIDEAINFFDKPNAPKVPQI